MLSLTVAAQLSLSYFKWVSHIWGTISEIQQRLSTRGPFSVWDVNDLTMNVAWGFQFLAWPYGSLCTLRTLKQPAVLVQDVKWAPAGWSRALALSEMPQPRQCLDRPRWESWIAKPAPNPLSRSEHALFSNIQQAGGCHFWILKPEWYLADPQLQLPHKGITGPLTQFVQ